MKVQLSLIILLTIIILHSYADQNLIETTCKNTPNYKLCTTVIRANPGSATADLPGLGLIVVATVKRKTKEALTIINKLKRSGGQPKMLAALKQCTEVYNAVLEGDIPVAEQVIRGNPKFAETAMADAGVEAEICEEAFEGVAKSPLTKVNNYVTDVAAVARAIVRNLL